MNFEAFKSTLNGKQTKLFQLKNDKITAFITNYGGRVVSLLVPDRDDNKVDVVLGFDSIEKYIHADEQYHGAIIGRVGNRIARGKFNLEDRNYTLAINCGEHTLHGGIKGYQAVVWDVLFANDSSLVLSYHSKDMEEGFPGNLTVQTRFELIDNALHITFSATTDKTTVVNLTHHNYFNLMGENAGSVVDQELQINASNYLPLDETSVPTGQIEAVIDTPFDFTSRKKIGADIESSHPQTTLVQGYDHNYVLDKYKAGSRTPFLAATAWAANGIKMSILTNEPGIQLYTGNFLSGKDIGKGGSTYGPKNAFCLEQQHYPDSPNQPEFPSITLHPGDEYYSICIQKFEAE